MGFNHVFDKMAEGLPGAFISLWPLWALFAVILLIQIIPARIRQQRLARAGMPEIDQMSGQDFEKRLEVLFRALGYHVDHTGQAGDYGADLVISKAGVRTIVQAKRWKKSVGVDAIQQAVAAKSMYQATAAMVVTNNWFTAQARTLAQSNGVELWDRQQLADKLLSVQRTSRTSATVSTPTAPPQLAAATSPALPVQAPVCPKCNLEMVLRTARQGVNTGKQFYGCPNYPGCRSIVQIASN
jgi:restriction system protein